MQVSKDMDKDEIHKSLSNTAVELTYKFWNLSRATITQRPSEGGWSPLEILIHLRMTAEVFAGRVKRMIKVEEGGALPKLHDFDEFKQMAKVDLDEETPKANITAFMSARSGMLILISFDDEIWESKRCIHKIKGEITLRELLIPLVIREKKFLAKLEELIPE